MTVGQVERNQYFGSEVLSHDLSGGDRSSYWLRLHSSIWSDLAIHCSTVDLLSRRTVAADVASLAAAVASLASAVQWTAIWRGAVPGNVAKLAASIALHGLGLAVTSKVVWTTALVTSRSTVGTGETTSETATVSATSWSSSATAGRCSSGSSIGGWAVALLTLVNGAVHAERATYCEMASLTARVAVAGTTSASAQSQSWAVGLDVAEALTVVALLGCIHCEYVHSRDCCVQTYSQLSLGVGSCCSHGLLQAVNMNADTRSSTCYPYLAACSCSTGAHCWSKPRHSVQRCRTCSMLDAKETTS